MYPDGLYSNFYFLRVLAYMSFSPLCHVTVAIVFSFLVSLQHYLNWPTKRNLHGSVWKKFLIIPLEIFDIWHMSFPVEIEILTGHAVWVTLKSRDPLSWDRMIKNGEDERKWAVAEGKLKWCHWASCFSHLQENVCSWTLTTHFMWGLVIGSQWYTSEEPKEKLNNSGL